MWHRLWCREVAGSSSSTSSAEGIVRLYSTEILLAITSSPLSWTPDGFSLVGYSLGGGIAAAFAVDIPNLVKDVVLLAPSGLIRSHHFGWSSRLVFLPIIPDFVTQAIVGRRLRGTAAQKSKDAAADSGNGSKSLETGNVVNAEIKGNRDSSFESAGLSKARPNVTVADAVQWQVERHEGFIKSFTSSVRYAPIERQEETWKALRKRDDKILILAGKKDVVIVHDELKEDVSALLGDDRFIWEEMDGGHEFPIAQGDEVGRIVAEAWGL
jgi:pimeloyl-ACP methyl ester carboxylesterase